MLFIALVGIMIALFVTGQLVLGFILLFALFFLPVD